MRFKEYQEKCKETWISNKFDKERIHYGLAEEIGELLGKVKKFLRGDIELEDYLKYKQELKKELGDVFYYLAMFCNKYDFNSEEIMKDNIEKLKDRKNRDQIKGSGD